MRLIHTIHQSNLQQIGQNVVVALKSGVLPTNLFLSLLTHTNS